MYRGDIETIVAKALEKDKARRYPSAAELAADIRRYLNDQPIVARPPSTSYQLRKFARRHRTLVTGVVAVFVVLAAGVVASTWQAVRARRAEAAADAVNDFLQNDLLAQASAADQSGPNAQTRSGPESANSPGPGGGPYRGEVRPAARGGGRHSGHHRADVLDLGLYPEARTAVATCVRCYTGGLGG